MRLGSGGMRLGDVFRLDRRAYTIGSPPGDSCVVPGQKSHPSQGGDARGVAHDPVFRAKLMANQQGVTLTALSAEFGVAREVPSRWWARYAAEDLAGLQPGGRASVDGSSVPGPTGRS